MEDELRELLLMCEGLQLWNLIPRSKEDAQSTKQFCNIYDGRFCNIWLWMLLDQDPEIDDLSRMDVLFSNFPSGSSVYNYVHYGQLMALESPGFYRYDHGSWEDNMLAYNETSPPAYNLSLIHFPIALLSGSQDRFATPADVEWTAS